jgi:acetyl-CoA C-acetyltransferase
MASALNDLDAWEINEAFAAQVSAASKPGSPTTIAANSSVCLARSARWTKRKLNVDGGAVAIGHPVGASGARIVLHLLHVLRRKQGQRGIATICIGGGLGGAMLVERLASMMKHWRLERR